MPTFAILYSGIFVLCLTILFIMVGAMLNDRNRGVGAFSGLWLAMWFWAAWFWGWVAYIAVHFLSKYW